MPQLRPGPQKIPLHHRNTVDVGLTGLDIQEKVAFVEAAFWNAYPFGRDDVASVRTEVIRSDKADAKTNAEATAVWRITMRDPDESKVGRSFTNALIHTALASIPGLYALSGAPTGGRPYGVYRPGLVPAALVPARVTLPDGTVLEVSSALDHDGGSSSAVEAPTPPTAQRPPPGPTVSAPLGQIVGARSGDKGGDANLGVFARSEAAWTWLEGYLTVDKLNELLPETASLAVERHELPNLWSLNFVIRGLLDEGVAASTRQDAQAKSLGEWLRSRFVDIPAALMSAE